MNRTDTPIKVAQMVYALCLMKRRTQHLFRLLSRLADHITTVSEPVTQFLRDQIGIPYAKLQTIPNGVLVKAFQNAAGVARGRSVGATRMLSSAASRGWRLKRGMTFL